MRGPFEICQKILGFFSTFWCFLRFEGDAFDQKRCRIECFDVSRTIWKSPCLSPEKITIFPHLALFLYLSLSKIWLPTHFKLRFYEVQE